MKALALALCLLTAQAWGAFATGTVALYDCENNLTDPVNAYNGTPQGTPAYLTAGAWHGSYAFNANSAAGYFTVPVGVLVPNGAGTIEMSIRSPAAFTNSRSIFSISSSGGARCMEIYYFGGCLYAYGNGAHGTNTAFLCGLALSTNYYIKNTWDGLGNRQIWTGTWTVPGTVTLTRTFNSTGGDVGGTVSAVYLLNNAVNNLSDWSVDWVRFLNIQDNTATVTVDPVPPTLPAGWVLVNGLVRTQ